MTPSAFLLNPPNLPGSIANREGSSGMGVSTTSANPFVYPPHLLASAAAVLRAAHWQVSGLDAVARGLDAAAVLEQLPAQGVLVLPVSYGTQAADRAFLNRLRERKPLVKVLAIGPALTYAQVDHAFSDLADALLMGEAELALPAAAKRLLQGELKPGRALNPYTLAPEHYTPDGLLSNLDALPMPAWQIYHSARTPYPFLTVLSSRGCPAGCAYCPYVAAQGNVWRAQSPPRTAAEMMHLVQRHHVTHLMLRDPVFAHDRSRVLALCAELRRIAFAASWECESRPEHFDAPLLRVLRAAGCTTIKLGLESADPAVLTAIRRVPDEQAAAAYLDHVVGVVRACHEVGITCRVFVMTGLPDQTPAAVEHTARFLRSLRPIRLHAKPFHWTPGIALPPVADEEDSQQLARLQAAVQARPGLLRRVLNKVRP